ncbi:MAG: chromate efflux transporter [Oscillatoria sp. SIO1A7]|nr:chromate efflux transporter [Oscillatoria sp. SIO1A7]
MTERLAEVGKLFFKLGAIGFGGPAAHIAMMEDETVNRRQWLTREEFLDLVGATNLIPGPNSTEMAIHVGYIYAGWPGLIVAGVCFVLPAVVLTGILAWAYLQFGTLPTVAPLLYGIKPAVLAIIIGALWRLGKKALKSRQLLAIASICLVAALLGVNEVKALLTGGLLGMVWLNWTSICLVAALLGVNEVALLAGGLLGMVSLNWTKRGGFSAWAIAPLSALLSQTPYSSGNPITSQPPLVWQLGLFFLKIGAILFGSGYVLVAFLEGELVGRYGWLTQQQLLDAIAIGQFTPGPVLSTSTFIGYVIAGWPGAAAATLGIFLPSFLFVLLLNPLIPRLRSSPWTAAFLDSVNVSAVALMAAVSLKLAGTILTKQNPETPGLASLGESFGVIVSLIDWPALAIAIVAAILAIRFRVGAIWLVLGGALAGLVLSFEF